MRYESIRVQQSNQKQILKSTIKMYHRPEANELKPKSNPCIGFNQSQNSHIKTFASTNAHHSNHNAYHHEPVYEQLQALYRKLYGSLQKQATSFKDGYAKLKHMTILYYDELVKIVKASEKSAIKQIDLIFIEAQQRFIFHGEAISKFQMQNKNGTSKKSYEQLKSQIIQLSTLEVPVFQIEGNPFKQFQKIIQQFKPTITISTKEPKKSFIEQKHSNRCQQMSVFLKKSPNIHSNKQNEEFSPSSDRNEADSSDTIKKTQPVKNKQEAASNTCQFTCDEEFEWNPDEFNSRRLQKKQMVSQIIIEQPSSCEDSIMLSEGP